jgi:hypothetical protein
VHEQQQDRIVAPAPMERKAEWTRPEVDRLLAGGAEASDGADIDAADFQS